MKRNAKFLAYSLVFVGFLGLSNGLKAMKKPSKGDQPLYRKTLLSKLDELAALPFFVSGGGSMNFGAGGVKNEINHIRDDLNKSNNLVLSAQELQILALRLTILTHRINYVKYKQGTSPEKLEQEEAKRDVKSLQELVNKEINKKQV